jgi:hypothetical protein
MWHKIGLWIVLLCVSICTSRSFGGVEILDSQWRDDLVFDESTSVLGESWNHFLPVIKSGRGGTLQLFVKNTGTAAVTLDQLTINSKPVEELHRNAEISWWRLHPGKLPPGEIGSIMVRFKEAPEKVALSATGSGGLAVNLNSTPGELRKGFRIESVGFDHSANRVWVYFRKTGSESGKSFTSASINGQEVAQSWLSKQFVGDITGVALSPTVPLKVGDYIYLSSVMDNGVRTSYVIRVNDGWVQLGLFDEPSLMDLNRLARNGMNTISAHRPFTKEQLDSMGRLGMRAVAFTDQAVPQGLLLHQTYDSHYVIDEPDVWDYYFWDRREKKPDNKEKWTGHHGPGVVKAVEELRVASNGRIQPSVVVDSTIRPWNWYEYGESADMICRNNYIFANNVPMRDLRIAESVAITASAPVPVVHAFESTWHEFDITRPRINRPKTAGEYRRVMLYTFGLGARGLTGWWNVNDRAEPYTSYATYEFPDQWAEQGKVFAELRQASPLIAIGCAIRGVSTSQPDVWAGGVLAGADSVLVTVVNEAVSGVSTYEGTSKRARNVKVVVPKLPWFQPAKAVVLDGFDQVELKFSINSEGNYEIDLPEVVSAHLVVLTSDASLPQRLHDRARSEMFGDERSFGSKLLLEDWNRMLDEGRLAAIQADLHLNRRNDIAYAIPLEGGSRDRHPDFDNPDGQEKPEVGWYTLTDSPARVGFRVPFELARAAPVTFTFQSRVQILPLTYELWSDGKKVEGATIKETRLANYWTIVEVQSPAAGKMEFVGVQMPLPPPQIGVLPGTTKYWPYGGEGERPKPSDDNQTKWAVRTGYVSSRVFISRGVTLGDLVWNEPTPDDLLPPASIPANHSLHVDSGAIVNQAIQQIVSNRSGMAASEMVLGPGMIAVRREAQGPQPSKADPNSGPKIGFVEVVAEGRAKPSKRADFWDVKANPAEPNAVELFLTQPDVSGSVSVPARSSGGGSVVLLVQARSWGENAGIELSDPSGKPVKGRVKSRPIGGYWWAIGVEGVAPHTEISIRLSVPASKTERGLGKFAVVLPNESFTAAWTAARDAVRGDLAKNGKIPKRPGKEFWRY